MNTIIASGTEQAPSTQSTIAATAPGMIPISSNATQIQPDDANAMDDLVAPTPSQLVYSIRILVSKL